MLSRVTAWSSAPSSNGRRRRRWPRLDEGRVTDTEVGDEESYYEVEVGLADGRQVDLRLDEGFAVVDARADRERDRLSGAG